MHLGEKIITYLGGLPHELTTLLISAFPIVELRGAIPIAITIFHMSKLEALAYGIIGSLIPVIPILFALAYLEPILRKVKLFDTLIDKVFERTRAKSQIIKELELIGLILFIGIPLPGTGVWTGTLAAYIFGLNKYLALLAALIGTTMAGIIMVFLSSYIHLIFKYSAFIIIGIIALVIGYKLTRKNGNNKRN